MDKAMLIGLSLFLGVGMAAASSSAGILSPLAQYDSGVPMHGIQCRDSRVLMETLRGTPACVYGDSAVVMQHRGWTPVEPGLAGAAQQGAEPGEPARATHGAGGQGPDARYVTVPEPAHAGTSCGFCPGILLLPELPLLGEDATITVTINEGNGGYLPVRDGLFLEFFSYPPGAAVFPELDVVPMPGWSVQDGGAPGNPDVPSINDAYVMPVTGLPPLPEYPDASFTTSLRVVEPGAVAIGARVFSYGGEWPVDATLTDTHEIVRLQDKRQTYGEHSLDMIVGPDETNYYDPRLTVRAPLATDREVLEFREFVERRGGIGPEVTALWEANAKKDMMRLEGIYTEEEAERYLNFVTRIHRGYGEESIPWREVEQDRLSDDGYIAQHLSAERSVEENPMQSWASFYRYFDGQDGWNDGFGSTLGQIREYLAKDGYMTAPEIDRYVGEYLADDFSGAQNFSPGLDFLPRAYAAPFIHLEGRTHV